MQIRVEIAPAPPDVVRASHQVPLSGGPGEPVHRRGTFFDDGCDPLVTEVPAEDIVSCFHTKPTSQ